MPHPLFRLGNRLALCASMVREGTKLADIGTDHAYLPIWLARKGRISSAIAADVKPLPLRSAEQNIRRYHVEEQITTRLSDGLRALSPDEAGDIVLAGMGGEPAEALKTCFDYRGKEFRLRNAARDCASLDLSRLRAALELLSKADRMLKGSRTDRRVILEQTVAGLLAV